MIKNERQYRITKAQAEKFEQSLAQLMASPQAADMHPIERQLHQDAVRSQLDELRMQLSQYEALRSGKESVLHVTSFIALPRTLIQARIAAGFSQKELAERLGLKEQQIQQYEATEYASASMSRVQEVIDALGVLVREEVFLPSADVTRTKLFQRMQSVGIDKDLIIRRILPRPLAARLMQETKSDTGTMGSVVLHAASVLERVFQLRPSVVFSNSPLQISSAALGSARFKLPAKVNEQKMSAYTMYAHYLALLSLDVTRVLEPQPVPSDPREVRRTIIASYGALTFENTLRYVWSLGIPVLPLSDSGSFHGACWRVGGRNVIVLKQGARSLARWLYDLLHELCHAGQKPHEEERTVVEVGDILQSSRDSEEEEEAGYFAEDAIFDGRAQEIEDKCYQRAGNYGPNIKRVVPIVAAEEGVLTGALANHIAHKLSLAHINWWGVAALLQEKDIDPWTVARDMFREYADFSAVNEIDRNLLMQALTSGTDGDE
jgi:transcriptional regulator with XRE-family HTH domain